MLTKKDDFYKDLNLSGNLNDIEIDLDGDCEDLEDFLKKDNSEDEKEYYAQAAKKLYHEGIIDLYADSTESDFSTESVDRVYEDEDDEEED